MTARLAHDRLCLCERCHPARLESLAAACGFALPSEVETLRGQLAEVKRERDRYRAQVRDLERRLRKEG